MLDTVTLLDELWVTATVATPSSPIFTALGDTTNTQGITGEGLGVGCGVGDGVGVGAGVGVGVTSGVAAALGSIVAVELGLTPGLEGVADGSTVADGDGPGVGDDAGVGVGVLDPRSDTLIFILGTESS